jgi:hypothetical protein
MSDDTIKNLLNQERHLRDFFTAFLPETLDFAEFTRLEYLDKEHPRTGRKPRRIGDILVKVGWQGHDAAFLIHIESQHKPQQVIVERAVEYAMRDAIRYGLPVMPVVLLTYPSADPSPTGRLK